MLELNNHLASPNVDGKVDKLGVFLHKILDGFKFKEV